MAIEKERKFLVKNLHLINPDFKRGIIQIYIVDEPDHSLRVRIVNNMKAYICYKKYIDAETKIEHEYGFPLKEALEIYRNKLYLSVLEKTRYYKDGWEIDSYNDILIIAEYEYTEEKPFPNTLPEWIGEEVTGKEEYSNPYIARNWKNYIIKE